MEPTRWGAVMNSQSLRESVTEAVTTYTLKFGVAPVLMLVSAKRVHEYTAAVDGLGVAVEGKEWVVDPLVFFDKPGVGTFVPVAPVVLPVLLDVSIPADMLQSVSVSEVVQSSAVSDTKPQEPKPVRRQQSGAGAKIRIEQIIEHGLLQPGEVLRYNKRSDREATMLATGRLAVGEKSSTIHQVGLDTGHLTSCNGWESWYVLRTIDGESVWVKLDYIRVQLTKKLEE